MQPMTAKTTLNNKCHLHKKPPKHNIRIYGLGNMFYMKFYLMLEILESGVKIGIGTMECLTRQAGKAALFKDYLGT